MSRIGKIYQEKTRDGNLLYPQTVSEAVIDAETGQNVKRVLENIKDAAGLGENYDWTPVAGGDSIREDLENLSSEKVDKVSGKVLSDNNYTTAEKSKVGNLPENTILELSGKQGMLTPGDGIDITGGIISSPDLESVILEIDALLHPQTLSALPELCGQPMILFGNGTPQESIVPINWHQYDKDTDTGYNWNGLPSALGQQYIDMTGGTTGRYIGVKDGEYKLKWQNC